MWGWRPTWGFQILFAMCDESIKFCHIWDSDAFPNGIRIVGISAVLCNCSAKPSCCCLTSINTFYPIRFLPTNMLCWPNIYAFSNHRTSVLISSVHHIVFQWLPWSTRLHWPKFALEHASRRRVAREIMLHCRKRNTGNTDAHLHLWQRIRRFHRWLRLFYSSKP